jgi:phosphatidylserine decarboxylase
MRHQYMQRHGETVMTETLFADRIVRFLYSEARESAPLLFRLLTGARVSHLLGALNFDLPLASTLLGSRKFLTSCGVDLRECVGDPGQFRTPRRIFERKIRYWESRPMPEDRGAIVSPADAKVLVGSLHHQSPIFLKGKFFDGDELLGNEKPVWHRAFEGGEFAVFRLTPEKYHYNHTPVSGCVADFYEVHGSHHSCNPAAVVELVTPYSKNRRVVTVIDTDVPGGTQVGLVAMVEVVALMIGAVVQCYSEARYERPQPVTKGMFLKKGLPKSLYRPGSSTDVLLFQSGRVRFAEDLVRNMKRCDADSRFSLAFGRPLVETDVAVRSLVAMRQE